MGRPPVGGELVISALGVLLLILAAGIAVLTSTSSDGGLRIFDGGVSFAVAIFGLSLVSG
jgi:hypothetical protein